MNGAKRGGGVGWWMEDGVCGGENGTAYNTQAGTGQNKCKASQQGFLLLGKGAKHARQACA